MKIAVTYDNGNIFQHFGRTENFNVYDVEDGKVVSSQIIGSTSCRSETGYGTMMLRRIITTQRFEQGKDYWLRIKNLVNDKNLGWSFDFIELVPLDIVNSQTMTEDWY